LRLSIEEVKTIQRARGRKTLHRGRKTIKEGK